MCDEHGYRRALLPQAGQALGPQHLNQMRTDRKRHSSHPGSPPQRSEQLLPSQQIVLGQNPPPAPEELRPVRPSKMTDDRPRLIAKTKSYRPCAKGPIHILRNSGAKAAHGVEDLAPHPHVSTASVPVDENVSLEIKPEHHFPSLHRRRPQRIPGSGHDTPTGKVIFRERTHSVFDPVLLRVAVAVDERQDITPCR